ncbi:MAG: methionine aminopeptidase methionyl aminopeptidase [Candidatus Paceibacter sp.]|jgi:methionyl aminopeptidase|nr:methionine aminopeptidase methionyl aminopeptidase [Candidatus Paceibacter sp.]
MITIKTEKEIEILKEGGKRLATILKLVAAEVRPGVMTDYLNTKAQELIEAGGDKSAFLDYQPKGAPRPFPASLCVSINDEVVHGIPNEKPRELRNGDVVSLDLGLIHNKMFTDHATTVGVGEISAEAKRLLEVTQKALNVGIAAAKPGKRTGDIGYAIQKYVEKFGFGIIEELAGHGVGYSVHEDPFVPNYGEPNEGVLLKPGMVIAIEPMFTLGKPDIKFMKDGYTIKTKDKSLAAHFEHTIVITETGAEILTRS